MQCRYNNVTQCWLPFTVQWRFRGTCDARHDWKVRLVGAPVLPAEATSVVDARTPEIGTPEVMIRIWLPLHHEESCADHDRDRPEVRGNHHGRLRCSPHAARTQKGQSDIVWTRTYDVTHL